MKRRGPYKKCASDFDRFLAWVSPEPTTGCWLWTGCETRFGYGRFTTGYPRKPQLAHRVSFELHRGPIPSGLCVLHKCDNPRCVNPHHLFIGTYLDNGRDRATKGRTVAPMGARNGRAKFTEEEVITIRQLFAAGQTKAALARRFNVAFSSIKYVLEIGWGHIE